MKRDHEGRFISKDTKRWLVHIPRSARDFFAKTEEEALEWVRESLIVYEHGDWARPTEVIFERLERSRTETKTTT